MSRRSSRIVAAPPRPTAPAAPVPLTHPAHALAILVAVACVIVSVSFRMYDLDVWQHLVFGKAMAMLGEVPRTQLWTWPDRGAPIANPSWGFSWAVWPFWAWGGAWGLALWRVLTTLVTFTLAYVTARRLGARGVVTLLAIVVCALVARSRSQVRPETLAAVWLALVPFLLHGVRRPLVRDVGLLVVALAWANSHVSWWLGPLLVVLHALALARSRERRGDATRLALVALAMVALAALNPFGLEGMLRPFRFAVTWRHDAFLAGISELQPIDWASHVADGLPLVLLGWPLLALARMRRQGFDVEETLVCVLFTALALQGSRFVAPYAIVAAPWCARDLDAWMADRRTGFARASAWTQGLVVALVMPLACAWEWTHFEGRLGVTPDLRRAPVAACDFMQAHDVRGRMLNDFFLGGYLLWRFWPDSTRAPYMDIHPEDTPAPRREAVLAAFTSRRGFEALDARERFDQVLLSRSPLPRAGLADLLDRERDWALVHVDDATALYLRRDGSCAAVADSFAYPVLPGGALALAELRTACAQDTALARQVWGELERQRASSRAHARFDDLRAVCATSLGIPFVRE